MTWISSLGLGKLQLIKIQILMILYPPCAKSENYIKKNYNDALYQFYMCYTIDPEDEDVKKRIERLEELISFLKDKKR